MVRVMEADFAGSILAEVLNLCQIVCMSCVENRTAFDIINASFQERLQVGLQHLALAIVYLSNQHLVPWSAINLS